MGIISGDIKMNRTRWIIFIALILVIVIAITTMYVKKVSIFAEYKTLFYPDGCKEEFKNGVPTTKLCVRGRILQERNITIPPGVILNGTS